MPVTGAQLELESSASRDALARQLDAAVAGSPFTVSSIDHLGERRHRCVLGLRRDGLAVGYRSLLELQFRMSQDVELVGATLCRAPAGRLATSS